MPSIRLISCLLLILMSADLCGDDAVLTGSALAELGADPPAPPPGYATSQDVLAAAQQGKVKAVNPLAPAPENVKTSLDVEYGKVGERSLKLDLYEPKDLDRSAPGLIFIHGGAWSGGTKDMYRYYGHAFAPRGYVVASISYRLSGEALFPAALEDCKCAVRWMRANAERLHVDPDRIAVAGGSAGGHLALMVGYVDDPKLEGTGGHAGVSSRVQAVVNFYGPTDLTTDFVRTNTFAKGAVEKFLGKPYDDDPKLHEFASPVAHLDPRDPPTLTLHGTIDDVVPIEQGDILAAKLKELGVPYLYDRLPGWPHAMDLAQDVNDRGVWLMERFFARYLRAR